MCRLLASENARGERTRDTNSVSDRSAFFFFFASLRCLWRKVRSLTRAFGRTDTRNGTGEWKNAQKENASIDWSAVGRRATCNVSLIVIDVGGRVQFCWLLRAIQIGRISRRAICAARMSFRLRFCALSFSGAHSHTRRWRSHSLATAALTRASSARLRDAFRTFFAVGGPQQSASIGYQTAIKRPKRSQRVLFLAANFHLARLDAPTRRRMRANCISKWQFTRVRR